MKRIPDMRGASILLFVFCSLTAWSQLVQKPIRRKAVVVKQLAGARIQSAQPLSLPFWDDFSSTRLNGVPSDSLWEYGQSVWVNEGMGINPPSINVATFDGLDSLGAPYNTITPLAKGTADRLQSRPIAMSKVTPADSIFIFFQYEWQGRGEPPDLGDELSLWFKSHSGEWSQVWYIDVDTTDDATKFIPVKLMITDTSYFHDDFQFRFQNFGRLSGMFDTWNVDYIYINNGKRQYDTTYLDFPDRAFATHPTSPFKTYQAIPVKHFLTSPDSVQYPNFNLTNLRKDQNTSDNGQPVSYTYYVTTSILHKDKTFTSNKVQVDTAQAAGDVVYDIVKKVTVQKLPDFSTLDATADSVALTFDMRLDKGDNEIKFSEVDIVNGKPKTVYKGDYDTAVYHGMNFHSNDTVRVTYSLADYYAYDDGTAEYAVTLTQPGSQVAYQFNLFYPSADTLVALDVYFPHVGDETAQVLMFKVWDSLTTTQRDSVEWTVARSENNRFTRVYFNEGILVNSQFFVGWKQNSTANLGIGFDKESDTSNRIYYKVSTLWQQPNDLFGNLMIRPVFGNRPLSVITGIEKQTVHAYPNPNHGVFFLPNSAQGLQVVDVTGRQIPFVEEGMTDQKQVTLAGANPGLYLVRYFNGSQWKTEKLLVVQ